MPPRRMFAMIAFGVGGALAVAGVVAKARRDAADPARCVGLVPMGNRCCAAGQRLESGRCVGRPERCPPPLGATDLGCVAVPARVAVAGGILRAGVGDWEAEGRVRSRDALVGAFEIDAFEITEGAYAECADAGRCPVLRSTGEPGRALGGLARSDAEAYCAFRGGRLPTDDEWTFAAAGSRARRYPWGETGAVCRRGAWGLRDGPCGFGFAAPELAGAHPDGATPDGLHDLAGNVAEWVAPAPEEATRPARGSEAIPSNESATGRVRGGSFDTGLATGLRTWHAKNVRPSARSPEIGGRCAYAVPSPPADIEGSARSP